MQKPLKMGDYVLATKWSDGDPCDQFCVGFFAGIMPYKSGDRYIVVDGNGQPFRANGFRRCERISANVGDTFVRAAKTIGDRPGKSLWYWRRHPTELKNLCAAIDRPRNES